MEKHQPFQSDLMGIPPSATGESHTLFFGLFPNPNVRKAIEEAAAVLKANRGSGRGTNSLRYHMTLHFVGRYSLRPDDVIERLKRVGDHVIAKAFDMRLDVAGSFANADRPWWIGTSVSKELQMLRNAIVEEESRSRGKVPTRSAFVPHVTLFRDNRQSLETRSIDPVLWRVDSFCLIDSIIGSKSRYDLIEKWTLPNNDD